MSTFIIVFSYDRFAGFSSHSVLWFSATQLSFRRQFLRISNKETKSHRHLSSGILISNIAGEARFPTIFYNSPLDSTTIISSDLLHQSPFTIDSAMNLSPHYVRRPRIPISRYALIIRSWIQHGL